MRQTGRVTNAGWYPDPAGAPDTYRYWDGQAWSQMTTTQPSGGGAASSAPATPPAPPATPPAPEVPPTAATALPPAQPAYQQQPYQPQYQQPQYQQQPQPTWNPTPPPGGTGGTGGGSTGKTVGIVVAAVLVLALLGVGGFFGIRALSGDDDGGGDKKADDPTSQTSDGPTDETSSTVRPTGIQCTGGKPEPATAPDPSATTLTGGGLSIPKLDGYTTDARQSPAHTYADGFISQVAEVVPQKWISLYGVGAIPRAHGFEGVDSTAEIIMQCLTTNDQIYKGFSKRTDLKREEISVDGKPAYRITSEIRVKGQGLPIEGDVTTVVIVDTGDPASYGVFIGVAPIGDDARIAQEEQVIGEISVG